MSILLVVALVVALPLATLALTRLVLPRLKPVEQLPQNLPNESRPDCVVCGNPIAPEQPIQTALCDACFEGEGV